MAEKEYSKKYEAHLESRLANYEAVMMLQILTPRHIDFLASETFPKSDYIERYETFFLNNYFMFNEYYEQSLEHLNIGEQNSFFKNEVREEYHKNAFLRDRKQEFLNSNKLRLTTFEKNPVAEKVYKGKYLRAMIDIAHSQKKLTKQLIRISNPYNSVTVLGIPRETLNNKHIFLSKFGDEIAQNAQDVAEKIFQDKDISVFNTSSVPFRYL